MLGLKWNLLGKTCRCLRDITWTWQVEQTQKIETGRKKRVIPSQKGNYSIIHSIEKEQKFINAIYQPFHHIVSLIA